MMLPLEVGHDPRNDASNRTVRRFLKVTDFVAKGPHEVGDRDTVAPVPQVSLSCHWVIEATRKVWWNEHTAVDQNGRIREFVSFHNQHCSPG